jgi:hypothetical protein
MSRKHPKARRATALTLLTSLFLVLAAASAVALHSSTATAGTRAASPPVVSSRVPLPGDPNTPDEGRASGSSVRISSSPSTSPVRTFFDWVKGLTDHYFLPSR